MALAALSGTASAQLAPPPGAAPEAPPVVVPPSMPSVRPPTDRPTGATPGAEPARAQSAEERIRASLSDEEKTLLELPYDSLVVRGDDGRVVPVTGNPHVLAMERNPLMDESSIERAQGVMAERRARVEQKVIENIDLIQRVLDGVIDNAVITDQASVAALLAVVRPFQEMGHLTEDLKAQGVLTNVQYVFNWNIVREYEQAMLLQAQTNPGGEHPGTYMTRQVMGDFLREPMMAYDAMLLEGAGRLDQAMAGITIADDHASQAATDREAVERASDDASRLAAMRAFTSHLDPSQKGQFLRNVVESR